MRKAKPPIHARQSGIATIAIAFLIVLLMQLAILGASTLSTGVALDSEFDQERATALFMAETGLERAAAEFNLGTVNCAGLTEASRTMTSSGSTLGTVQLTSFTTDFSGNTIANTNSNCRVRAVATTASGQVTRAIEAMLQLEKGSGTRGNRTLCCPFSSGSNQLLVVGLSWADTGGGFAATMISGGNVLTAAYNQVSQTNGGSTYSSQMFYQLNPTGTATSGCPNGDNVRVSFSGTSNVNDNLTDVDYQCYLLTSVTSSPPIDTVTGTFRSGGSGNTATLSFTTSSTVGNRWIIDNVGFTHNGNFAPQPSSACTDHDTNNPNLSKYNGSGLDGEGVYCGPVGASTTVGLQFQKSGQAIDYAYGAAAFFYTSSGTVTKLQSNYVTLGTPTSKNNAIGQWREITVPPS